MLYFHLVLKTFETILDIALNGFRLLQWIQNVSCHTFAIKFESSKIRMDPIESYETIKINDSFFFLELNTTEIYFSIN